MKERNRNYSLSFKQKAVELSIARGNVKQVRDELDIPYSVLHRWEKESGPYGKNSFWSYGPPRIKVELEKLLVGL